MSLKIRQAKNSVEKGIAKKEIKKKLLIQQNEGKRIAGAFLFISLFFLSTPLLQGKETTPHPVTFVDVTEEAKIYFKHTSGASDRKYFIETMGSGGSDPPKKSVRTCTRVL